MAWENLRAEIEAELSGLANAHRVEAAGLFKSAGTAASAKEWRERDASIPLTKAQLTDRRRKSRAARVAGLARGQRAAFGG